MSDSVFTYPGLKSSIIVQETNISYYNTRINSPQDPLSGSTIGLMMILSTLQYQPSLNAYSGVNEASKAAFIQSGGQDFQNRLLSVIGDKSRNTIHSIGITDAELGTVLGTAKVIRNKHLEIKGPKIYSIKTNLTLNQDNGNVGLKYEW